LNGLAIDWLPWAVLRTAHRNRRRKVPSQARILFTPEGHEDRIGTFFNGSFQCDDVDYCYRQLSERGVDIDPPEKQPWGTFCRFRDPDGNSFILSSR